MQIQSRVTAQEHGLRVVRSPVEIEFLVKESEFLTGQAGRTFVISSADWLTYRVHWHPLGFKVERLDDGGSVVHIQHLLPWDFAGHNVTEALASGQLFTAPVRRPG